MDRAYAALIGSERPRGNREDNRRCREQGRRRATNSGTPRHTGGRAGPNGPVRVSGVPAVSAPPASHRRRRRARYPRASLRGRPRPRHSWRTHRRIGRRPVRRIDRVRRRSRVAPASTSARRSSTRRRCPRTRKWSRRALGNDRTSSAPRRTTPCTWRSRARIPTPTRRS